MGEPAPTSNYSNRLPPEDSVRPLPWTTIGVAITMAAIGGAFAGMAILGTGTIMASACLGLVGIVLASPSLRGRTPVLKPGWRALAERRDLQIDYAGDGWQISGSIEGVHLTVRVEHHDGRDYTVALIPLSGVDLHLRLAQPGDPTDAPGRRWMADLIATGQDAAALALLGSVEAAQLLREMHAGVEIENGNVRFSWPGVHHRVDALQDGLIAGPLWIAKWLRGYAVSPTRILGDLAASEAPVERRTAAVASIFARDSRYPRLSELVAILRRHPAPQSRLVAMHVLGEYDRVLATLGDPALPGSWRQWSLETMLDDSNESIRKTGHDAAVAMSGPDLLDTLHRRGQLAPADHLAISQRWSRLDSSIWDREPGHRVLQRTVEVLFAEDAFLDVLSRLSSCPAYVRREVSRACGHTGHIDLAPILLPLRTDPDVQVARVVAKALQRLGIAESESAEISVEDRPRTPQVPVPPIPPPPVAEVIVEDDANEATTPLPHPETSIDGESDSDDRPPTGRADKTDPSTAGEDVIDSPDEGTENTAIPSDLDSRDLAAGPSANAAAAPAPAVGESGGEPQGQSGASLATSRPKRARRRLLDKRARPNGRRSSE